MWPRSVNLDLWPRLTSLGHVWPLLDLVWTPVYDRLGRQGPCRPQCTGPLLDQELGSESETRVHHGYTRPRLRLGLVILYLGHVMDACRIELGLIYLVRAERGRVHHGLPTAVGRERTGPSSALPQTLPVLLLNRSWLSRDEVETRSRSMDRGTRGR